MCVRACVCTVCVSLRPSVSVCVRRCVRRCVRQYLRQQWCQRSRETGGTGGGEDCPGSGPGLGSRWELRNIRGLKVVEECTPAPGYQCTIAELFNAPLIRAVWRGVFQSEETPNVKPQTTTISIVQLRSARLLISVMHLNILDDLLCFILIYFGYWMSAVPGTSFTFL